MESFNPSSTRLTPKENGYREQSDQLMSVLKDILVDILPQNENKFKVNSRDVTIECFTFRLYSEVIEHLVDSGYSSMELKEDKSIMSYELLDALNEVIQYGEEINDTYFKVETKDHWKTFKEVRKILEIVMEE